MRRALEERDNYPMSPIIRFAIKELASKMDKVPAPSPTGSF